MKDEFYTFPAIISKVGQNYGVYFCDLPGCIATGATIDEAVRLAKDGLSLHIYGLEQDGIAIPSPTPLDDITLHNGEYLCLLDASTTPMQQIA